MGAGTRVCRTAPWGALALLLASCTGGLTCSAPSDRPAAHAPEEAPPGDRNPDRAEAGHPESLSVRVLEERPHATDAFTQGLLFHDGFLYESTGQRGRSTLRKVNPQTGEVVVRRDLPDRLFAEGLALISGSAGTPAPPDGGTAGGARLIQLTWQSGLALVWDLATLERVGEHRYDGEGWGLAFDGEHLVMSDGSSTLSLRDPETFAEVDRVEVRLGGHPLAQLNELEWAAGALWANVWGSSTVVRIDLPSGRVTATADLGKLYGLLPVEESARIDVLNGIAYRPAETVDAGGTFLVTGKYWPRLFEVAFEPPNVAAARSLD